MFTLFTCQRQASQRYLQRFCADDTMIAVELCQRACIARAAATIKERRDRVNANQSNELFMDTSIKIDFYTLYNYIFTISNIPTLRYPSLHHNGFKRRALHHRYITIAL